MKLPVEMLVSANVETNEEAWAIADFPGVLELATRNGLACLGGQFQFRGPLGIAEMHWIDADSTPSREGENWHEYVKRANREVRLAFERRVAESDFRQEALAWPSIRVAMETGKINDPRDHLYFVAYFDREQPAGR